MWKTKVYRLICEIDGKMWRKKMKVWGLINEIDGKMWKSSLRVCLRIYGKECKNKNIHGFICKFVENVKIKISYLFTKFAEERENFSYICEIYESAKSKK